MLNNIGKLLGGLFLTIATLLNPSLGGNKLGSISSFNPTQAGPTVLSGAGITSGATAVNVTAFTTRQGTPITTANIGSIVFLTVDPGTVKEENISCTGITQNTNGSAQFTGCLRGLLPIYPYTPSSSLAIAHSGGATVITSNSAPFYAQFNIAANTSTITGNWTFASSSLPQVSADTTNAQVGASQFNFATIAYVASTSFAGVSNGSFVQKGIFQLATTTQLQTSSSTGSTGAVLVVGSQFVSQSSTANHIPIAGSLGIIDPAYIGGNLSITSLISASTTLSGILTIPFATSSVLVSDSVGRITGAAGATTGTILSFKNGAWSTGVYETFATSSITLTTTTVTNVVTTTMPLASPNSVFDITFSFAGNSATGAVTSTIKLFGTTIWTCNSNSPAQSLGNLYAHVVMQNSTSAEVISTVTNGLPANAICATPSSTLSFSNVNLSAAAFLTATVQLQSSSSLIITSTSTITVIQ